MPHIRSQDTVASALSASDDGMPDRENAALHGVAVSTIRRWRRLYQRRGQPRGQQHLLARCPRCADGPLDGPAYAELFGWYLGDGHISQGRRGVYNLHIYNDLIYPVDNTRILNLMLAVKPASRPHTRLLAGCLATTVSWKHWPCLFPQHGPGRKHQRTLTMTDWQWAVVEEHPGPFLRGLFHSDGARVHNWTSRVVGGERTRYDYPRWQFVNMSTEIRQWCCDALDLVEVAWRVSNHKTISVSRRDAVARLDALIGPKS